MQEPTTNTSNSTRPTLPAYWLAKLEEWEQQRREEEARDPNGGLVVSL